MGVYRKGRNYYIDYYYHGKRKREMIGESKKLAELTLKKRKLQIAENKFLDIDRKEKIKFEDFTEEFLKAHSKPNKKSWECDFHHLKALKSFFSGKYLYEITTEDIERYKAKRLKSVSPATVNRQLSIVKTLFNKAVAWKKLKENPAKGVKFLRESNQRLRFLEKEEIKKLLFNCSDRLRPVVMLAVFTGMRRGEILNLKWHDIDFQRDLIYLIETKNNEQREIPMNDIVKNALVRVHKHPESPYIFCNKDGKPYHDIRKSFYTALKKSDIMDFRFHDLRHTFASHLVMAGVDLNTVRELLGHKDIRMTLRYSHLSPKHKKRAVDILSKHMDTIWTPEKKAKKQADSDVSQLYENIGVM